MEAADGSIHSKTIVQFTDPSNLFDDVAPLLQKRLPLGNLHWKSPSRPLRSIEELDVSLEREQAQALAGPRHQIPGLRQTPFVKVLLLRCDDKEQYKESVRKDAKEWVKSLGISSSGKPSNKGQERHDAFEYIVLHVVLPGTTAASQPKSSKHISVEATESTDSVNSTSKSKWTGKSSSTVFDKIRADFASSSKAPFERAAQIRLTDPAKPSNALSPLDIEEQWQDLIEKLKTAILQSFDSRVAQYEEDIRDREAQRTLPGWNFCTFFILKEGLARGFENVGLLEDALQMYEELDAGLDAVIQEQAKADFSDAANALLPYAADLKDIIRAVLEEQKPTNGAVPPVALNLQSWAEAEAKRFPWKLERRNYQQMILTNQVSALDFRIYMFIRQMQILLRRATVSVSTSKSRSNRQSGSRWDADILSGICQRSIRFIGVAARNLRQDLFAAWGGQEGLPEDELATQQLVIDNVVASWKWASCLQILTECQIISSFSSISKSDNDTDGELFSSSDIVRTQREHSMSTSTALSHDTASTIVNGSVNAANDTFAALKVVKGRKDDLIFQAAELFSMMRTIFLQVCKKFQLLPATLSTPGAGLATSKVASSPELGIRSPTLRSIMQGEVAALGAYKLLTVCACQCYTTADKNRAAKQLLFDLAKLEIHNHNHEAGLHWLDAVPGFLEEPPRTRVEQSMLELYIDCLRRGDRQHDLQRCLYLSLQAPSNQMSIARTNDIWTEMLGLPTDTGAADLPFDELFELTHIAVHITHNADGAMCLSATFRSLMPLSTLGIGKVSLQCQNRAQSTPTTIVFTNEEELLAVNGAIGLVLRAQVITEGWYDATAMILSFGKLQFVHNFRRSVAGEDEADRSMTPFSTTPSFYIYPAIDTPRLEVQQSCSVSLAKPKSVSVHIDWGDVQSAHLRLRPGTAGLRLDIASVRLPDDGTLAIQQMEDMHVFVFSASANSLQKVLEIPYSFEDSIPISASIKAELLYTTSQGDFQLHENMSFMPLLPIGVNVQDIFRTTATFSRFTFAPTRTVPLSVVHCQLSSTNGTTVLPSAHFTEPIDAFPKQPVSWVARIEHNTEGTRDQLRLQVDYRYMDEVVLSTIIEAFIAGIMASPCRKFARLLRAHLRSQIQALWTEQDLEIATLSSEIELWTFDQLDWTPALAVLARSDRVDLIQWLKEWHNANDILELNHVLAPLRSLEILVDPPYTQLLITTELKLLVGEKASIVGQPILAQLRCSTHRFDAKVSAEICLEVGSISQADLWLVGGQRKVTFSSMQDSFSSTIILVPQKTGKLVVPLVDVKCRGESKNTSVSFEVDNLSSARIVEIVSAIQSTTVAIGDGETAEGSWLVESYGRTDTHNR